MVCSIFRERFFLRSVDSSHCGNSTLLSFCHWFYSGVRVVAMPILSPSEAVTPTHLHTIQHFRGQAMTAHSTATHQIQPKNHLRFIKQLAFIKFKQSMHEENKIFNLNNFHLIFLNRSNDRDRVVKRRRLQWTTKAETPCNTLITFITFNKSKF